MLELFKRKKKQQTGNKLNTCSHSRSQGMHISSKVFNQFQRVFLFQTIYFNNFFISKMLSWNLRSLLTLKFERDVQSYLLGLPSFSIHERTGTTLTCIDMMHSQILYYPTCAVIYIYHTCIRDYAYSDSLQT